MSNAQRSSADFPLELKTLWTLAAPWEGEFGGSVAILHDIDGDGVRDMLVANPRFNFFGPGCAHFVSARNGAILSTFGEDRWRPHDTGEMFASDVVNLGDLDGDGLDDAGLVVLNESLFYDRSYIVSGSAQRIAARIAGVDSRSGGLEQMVRLADIDGDGRGDWLVITRDQRSRHVELRSGIEGGVLYSFAVARWRERPRVGERFENEIVVVGDVDEDGAPDFAMLSPPEDDSTWVTSYSGRNGSIVGRLVGVEGFRSEPKSLVTRLGGELVVYSQSAHIGTIHALTLDGSCARVIASSEDLRIGDYALTVAAIDDLDGDGVGELAALQRGYRIPRLAVVSGGSGARLYDASPTVAVDDQLEHATARGLFVIGDVDGDGISELALQVRNESVLDDEQGYGLCAIEFVRSKR